MTDEDKALLTEFGIEGYNEDLQMELLSNYYETCDLRVGMMLEEQLNDDQLEEFEKLHDAGDDAATQAWLQSAIVNYDDIVAAETAAVKADIKRTMAAFGKNSTEA